MCEYTLFRASLQTTNRYGYLNEVDDECAIKTGNLYECQMKLRDIMADHRTIEEPLSVYRLCDSNGEVYQQCAFEEHGVIRMSPYIRFIWFKQDCKDV